MKYEPVKDHAERRRILALIERCEKEQTMDDLIRREDIRTALKENVIEMGGDDWCEPGVHCGDIDAIVNSVPTTDRPQGKWIYWREDGIKRCKCARCLTSYGCLDTPYCPNCGAQMEGADE